MCILRKGYFDISAKVYTGRYMHLHDSLILLAFLEYFKDILFERSQRT